MLAWAGTGVVMGNAADTLKEGLEVTGTNDQAGLAQAIKKHIAAPHTAATATRR
jgi:hydroxymethylpyrimidine pyrophosphatase-like HAD family hydrolase